MSDASSEEQYFVRRRGRVEGPWSRQKVASEITLRKLGRRDEISTDGRNWASAGSFQQFFPAHAARKNENQYTEASTEPQVTHNIPESDLEEWHAVVNEEQIGPLSRQELGQMIQAGTLALDDLVWKESFPDWLELERVPELMSFLDSSEQENDQYDVTGATRLVSTSAPQVSGTDSQMAFYGLLSGLVMIPAFCCLFWLGGLLGIVPIVISVMGLMEIKKDPLLSGKGYAITGIILGSLYVLMGITLLILTVVGVIAIPYLSENLPWLN